MNTYVDPAQIAELRAYVAERRVIAAMLGRLTDDELLALSNGLGDTTYRSHEGNSLHTMLVRELSTRQALARRRHPTAHTKGA